MQNFIKHRILLFLLLISLVLGFGKTVMAADIILNDLDGKSVNLASYKGKPVMLLFWTTWCPYCREEIKKLNQQYPVMAKEGVIVFGVDLSEPDYKVQKFFKGFQLNLRILLDKTGWLADKYGLLGVPTYVFLDKNGEVISQAHSFPDDYKSWIFN